ncbi:origin recognition complex subunit 5 [Atheta coriaria]|uniref:origin recognition complex subunit 5 n=1 Tax=Dalotia coriaria TaxID=877792 RepID=UPI0031F435E8
MSRKRNSVNAAPDMDPVLNEVIKNFPGRKSQIEQLYNHYGDIDECYVDATYVHGGPSTGKTTIVVTLLRALGVKHAVVNLIECYTTKILLESILNQLAEHKVSPNHTAPYAKCDNMMEFVKNVKKYAAENEDFMQAVIVLDNAEKVRDMEFNLLPCFQRLRELTGLKLSTIFISELVYQKFFVKLTAGEVIKIHFSQYNKDEILEILALDFDDAKEFVANNSSTVLPIDLDFYKNYLNVFLSVFYRACRDFSELRYMARINFVKYIEPVIKNECAITDSMALWRHIAPTLKSSLEVLYLRLSATKTKAATFSKENLAQSLELPYYAKYLLIAAYLASYNPAKDDKRLFMKFHGKKTKSMRDVKAKSKVSECLNTQLGPKAFSFDRLLAIFYAILDEKIGFNNNLLVQVSSLVELQLLSALSDNFNLDGQKYKCTVGFDFVQTISKMVGFNIRKYLSDFSHI